MKKLYIETSVWNQLEHDDRPDWKETAENFMKTLKKGIYEPYISYVVVREIEATKDEARRARLVEYVNTISPIILEADEEVEALTELYMSSEFVNTDSLRVYNDCSHVAVATVNSIRHIISFNCKHLVNDRRIDGFNGINFKNGYDNVVDITTPHRFVLSDEQE
jgi:predicted nucleic acid-binding protein